jgi:poly-gamma-glutamate synthesis protein (capsule biosynthesis protein)
MEDEVIRPLSAGNETMIPNAGATEQAADREKAGGAAITLLLAGDVMTGRGIDQVLPYPSDPTLHEPIVTDAREYVALAESANGPIPRGVAPPYVWGDLIEEFDRARADLRIINLETAVTSSNDCWPDKGIHYRMHPANVDCLTAAGIDCCVLANNHVLDWGRAGLAETLDTLQQAGIRTTGVGRTIQEAQQPAVLPVAGKGRLLVAAAGSLTSGIPPEWSATESRSGVQVVSEYAPDAADRFREHVRSLRVPGDVVVASIHWGGNWGYEIPMPQRQLAHNLIDQAGVSVVHGHSSHHVKGIEVYRGRLILYGCGDLLTDYEGISGRERFRNTLGCLYFVRVDARTGALLELRLMPTRVRRFQLIHPETSDVGWLAATLNREGRSLGTHFDLAADSSLRLG